MKLGSILVGLWFWTRDNDDFLDSPPSSPEINLGNVEDEDDD